MSPLCRLRFASGAARLGVAGLLALAAFHGPGGESRQQALAQQAGGTQSPYAREIQRRIGADEGFSAEERQIWAAALDAGFTGAFGGLPSDADNVLDRVDTIFHVVIEGIFSELGPEDVVPVARAAFEARSKGAPPEAVEGIAQYGLTDFARERGIRLTANQIAAWAGGADKAKRLGVPGYIAEDFVAAALGDGWTLAQYESLNGALMDAVHAGYDPEMAGRYLLISIERGEKPLEEIIAEMGPYLERLRREETEKRRGQGAQQRQPEEKGQARTYDPFAGQRRPSAPGGSPRPTPPAGPPAAPGPTRSGPLLGWVPMGGKPADKDKPPARDSQGETARAAPSAPQRPVTTGAIIAQPGQTLGVVSRGALSGEMGTWIGTPYQWGGTRKVLGADCSGFTQGSYNSVRVQIPRVSRDQARMGLHLQPAGTRNTSFGDLVFFDTSGRGSPQRVTHVGVYLQNGRMIHASSSKGIIEADFTRRYYQSKYLFARRITQFTR